jgi:hypothetical protein
LSIVNDRSGFLSLTIAIDNWKFTIDNLLGFPVRGMVPAPGAVLLEFQPRLVVAAVFLAGVVALFALRTRQRDDNTNCFLCHVYLSGLSG